MREHQFCDSFFVADRKVGGGAPCFVVAEAGVSHFGDRGKAFALVDMAADAAADAVKFQVFSTAEMISSTSPEWQERMRTKELPIEVFAEVQAHARERGIIFFATAHDLVSLERLASLDPPCYKVGSGEVQNPEFHQRVAVLGRPLIVSTGMYVEEDFEEMLDAVWRAGCRDLAVMHCVTRYPTPPAEVNLRTIEWLRERFQGPVGYSDHCATFDIAAAAVLLGAKVIEKHITLERDIPGAQDWKVACIAQELRDFVAMVRRLEQALGEPTLRLAEGERESLLWARKSIVAARDIRAGEMLTRENVTCKRPGSGLSPSELPRLFGRRARAAIARDELIREDLLSAPGGKR